MTRRSGHLSNTDGVVMSSRGGIGAGLEGGDCRGIVVVVAMVLVVGVLEIVATPLRKDPKRSGQVADRRGQEVSVGR
jgi:hypothetical protein